LEVKGPVKLNILQTNQRSLEFTLF
jgi:hypothetical protein